MLIPIYPIKEGVWSFNEQPGEPVLVDVPEGSKLLEVKSVGVMLFVPSLTCRFTRSAWNPRQVITEAFKPDGRFEVAEVAHA